jgi:signal transduction histidine kinase
MNLPAIVLSLMIILNIGLALLVLFNNTKSQINRYFSAFVFAVVLWMSSNHLANNPVGLPLFWTKLTFLGAVLVAFFLIYFSFYFTKSEKKLTSWFNLFLISFTTLIIGLLFFTDKIIVGVTIIQTGTGVTQGSWYLAWPIYFLLFIAFSFYNLIRKFVASVGEERAQIRTVFIGLALSFLLAITTNMIFPLIFHNDTLSNFGPYSTLIFIGFTSYAIVYHGLLNIKVIATEALVVALNIALIFNALYSENPQRKIASTIVLLFSVFAGYLLIKSVLQEIERREQVQELAKKLEKDKEDLKELDRMKDEFLQMATHDLNTPITAIKGRLDMGIREDLCKLSQEQKKFFLPILNETLRLSELSDDILNVARIDQHRLKLNRSETDMDALISQIVSSFDLKAKEKGNSLAYIRLTKSLPKIMVDQSKIGEVIANLINNANKFTEKGKIAVTSKLTGDSVVISVADTGAGIEQEDQKHLFEKFYQAGRFDPRNPQEQQGSGLGLYISKNIIELHGGKIWFESERGKGSNFYFSLPLSSKAVEQPKKMAITDDKSRIP